MADGSGSFRALGDVPAGSRDIDGAIKLLGVLARLPASILRVQNERELRDVLGSSIAELLGPVRRYDLFVADGPAGTLVPSGEPREGLSLLGAAMSSGEPLAQKAMYFPGSGARGDIVSAPLADRAGTLGVLVVEAIPATRLSAVDLESVVGVAAQIALALQRLRLERRGAAHRRMERDMVLAREVQRRFLPAALPPGSGLRVAAHYRPAFDVGGDFYDLVPCGPQRGAPIMTVIGDVAGKGVAAALLMSRVSSDIRRLAAETHSPARLLAALNVAMTDEQQESFATAACIAFDATHGRAIVSNAGHVPPIIKRVGGSVTPFGRASGPPLGVLGDTVYTEEEITLAPGDMIFLMTDGLAEALDRPGDRLGMRLLTSIIADAPRDLTQVNQRILATVERERMLRHVDDVTLLAIQIEPAAEPAAH